MIMPIYADETCIPNTNDGACPDPCNMACCEYDPDLDTCNIPLNTNANLLIYIGTFMLASILVITYKTQILAVLYTKFNKNLHQPKKYIS